MDLTGLPDGAGGHLVCYQVPVDELSHWGTRAINVLRNLLRLDL